MLMPHRCQKRVTRSWRLTLVAMAAGMIVAHDLNGDFPAPRSVVVAGEESAKPVQRLDPEEDEDRLERRELGRRAVQENCLICHAEEMIASQRLTSAQWKAEVEKMIGWGAPLPPDQVTPVMEYLAETYSDTAPPVAPPRIGYDRALAQVAAERSATALEPVDIERGRALFSTNCATCHGTDAQGAELGPNLVENAVLLRPTDFGAVVRAGRHRMPGFQAVLSQGQDDEILAWLRRQRYRSAASK
jgi:mono/diheme cytochrome c family protein